MCFSFVFVCMQGCYVYLCLSSNIWCRDFFKKTQEQFHSIPVKVPDGYGIGYIIKDSQIHYAICSRHRQTTRYALTLKRILIDMANLLEPISNTKVHDLINSTSIPQQRQSLREISSDSANISSLDIGGEASVESICLATGKTPEVIEELIPTNYAPTQRWVGEDNIHSAANHITGTKPKPSTPRQIHSFDSIPSRPDRRESQSVTKSSLHHSFDTLPIRPNRRGSTYL